MISPTEQDGPFAKALKPFAEVLEIPDGVATKEEIQRAYINLAFFHDETLINELRSRKPPESKK